jgi:hypothetical protein
MTTESTSSHMNALFAGEDFIDLDKAPLLDNWSPRQTLGTLVLEGEIDGEMVRSLEPVVWISRDFKWALMSDNRLYRLGGMVSPNDWELMLDDA